MSHVPGPVIKLAWKVVSFLNVQGKLLRSEEIKEKQLADQAHADYVADGGQDGSLFHYGRLRRLSDKRLHIYNVEIPFIKEMISKIVDQNWQTKDKLDEKFIKRVKSFDFDHDILIE